VNPDAAIFINLPGGPIVVSEIACFSEIPRRALRRSAFNPGLAGMSQHALPRIGTAPRKPFSFPRSCV
jgi:hypothetical protein